MTVKKKNSLVDEHRTKKEKTNEFNMVGVLSDEIKEQNAKKKSRKEIEGENYAALVKHQTVKTVLYGQIYALERIDSFKNQCIVVLQWNGCRILIPDSEYFPKDFDFTTFNKNYHSLSEDEKLKIRQRYLSYRMGSNTPFIVKGVVKRDAKNKDDEGEYYVQAIASRTEALDILKDIYFYHKNKKRTDTPAREVHIGDLASANVLGVMENRVIVECMGIETRIDAHNISDDYVENCRDVVKVGDTIRVKIRKLYVDDKGIYMTVTARLKEAPVAIKGMKRNGMYMGTVLGYNRQKKYYNIILKNGVQAYVKEENVQGNLDLSIGDRVSVIANSIFVEDGFVGGKAWRI